MFVRNHQTRDFIAYRLHLDFYISLYNHAHHIGVQNMGNIHSLLIPWPPPQEERKGRVNTRSKREGLGREWCSCLRHVDFIGGGPPMETQIFWMFPEA